MMKKTILISLMVLGLSCSGDSITSPTPVVPQPTMTGAVTTFNVVPAFSFPTDYRHINYVVTTQSSRATSGCFVKVQWLDAAGVQIGFTYADTDAVIPEGESTITNQDYMHKDKSSLIKDSRVEYSLCN